MHAALQAELTSRLRNAPLAVFWCKTLCAGSKNITVSVKIKYIIVSTSSDGDEDWGYLSGYEDLVFWKRILPEPVDSEQMPGLGSQCEIFCPVPEHPVRLVLCATGSSATKSGNITGKRRLTPKYRTFLYTRAGTK